MPAPKTATRARQEHGETPSKMSESFATPTLRDALNAAMSEKQFQRLVLDLACLEGWHTYHTYDSRKSNPGFPDLCLLRRQRCLMVELKSERGKLSTAQEEWLAHWRQVPGIEVFCWKPSDWDAIEATLR